ncbi:MAG: hypothetical protein EXR12_10635 [Rhodospirillaceae bacterium]|nr:hypothetical protein [Rhodospirillaceae bacterium]
MELWTFHRYRQPCLSVDAIELDDQGPALVLRQGIHAYSLAVDDKDAAVEIARDLAALRDSAAPLWDVVRQCPAGQSWNAICEFLDKHSLIREGADDAAHHLAARQKRIEDCIADTIAAVLDDLGPDRRAAIAIHARTLRADMVARAAGRAFAADGDPFDATVQPNFFVALLVLELEYFRRASPLTLMAADSLLSRVTGEHDAESKLDAMADLSEAGVLYDLRDLEAHLWLVAQCLAAASADEARRLPAPPLPPLSLSSGLEFMRRTELLTREALRDWGQNPYVTALDALNDTYSPLVAGPFIEQYHVTRRFVEIIAPFLSKRLAPPLREMMFRYYSEEVGHEALESTTCEAMGVSQEALDRAVPLPLHFAFVDVLTLLADLDPISSFASIMVIEGVFGEPPKMSLRLAAVARTNPALREISGDHDELNETLNHNSISRDAFEHVAAVTPATQARVMRRILFLLELNHRAWGGIADFYGRQHQLWLQGALGRQLSPQGILQPRSMQGD